MFIIPQKWVFNCFLIPTNSELIMSSRFQEQNRNFDILTEEFYDFFSSFLCIFVGNIDRGRSETLRYISRGKPIDL